MKVLKFGGTSMASAENIMRSAEIAAKEDSAVIVVSAPGKSYEGDTKVTDMLIECYNAKLRCGRCDVPFAQVLERFLGLGNALNVVGIESHLDHILHEINSGASFMHTISRGEYLSALIMSHVLGCESIDAIELIKFDSFGNFDAAYSESCIKKRLIGCKKTVIPGFYGVMPNGEIRTFSRGGADITGAVVASAIMADAYENWTDVSGIYFCSATHLCSPVEQLSYRQARELAFMGAYVLHPDSVLYLCANGIKTVIKNTFNPKAAGTVIAKDKGKTEAEVLAFAGRKGFKLLSYFDFSGRQGQRFKDIISDIEGRGVSVFSRFGGVDSLTLLLDGQLSRQIWNELKFAPAICADLAVFTVLTEKKRAVIKEINALEIDYKIISADCSENGIILGVDESNYDDTLNKLCLRFAPKDKKT